MSFDFEEKSRVPAEQDLISILIPVYNAEAYIEECIQSVVRQSYTHLQIVLIIDGSTDGSEAICRRFAEQDPRIEIYCYENAGVSKTRNRGIDKAKGRFYFFLDSDDYITEDAIEYLYALMKKHSVDIVEGNISNFLESPTLNEIPGPWVPDSPEQERLLTREEAMFYFPRWRVVYGVTCGKLYKAEAFEGVRWDPETFYEDMDTIYRVINNCERYCYGNRVVLHYRIRKDSLVRSLDLSAALRHRKLSYEKMFRFYQQHCPECRGSVARCHLREVLYNYRLAASYKDWGRLEEVTRFLPQYKRSDLWQDIFHEFNPREFIYCVMYGALKRPFLFLLRTLVRPRKNPELM